MAVVCNATDSHLTSSVAGLPSAGSPISLTTWMSGIWSTATAGAKSFVGVYGPATPTTAIQIGSRTTNGTCQVWTWGGGAMVATPAIMVDNQLTFIAYTYDGTNHNVYINGVNQGTSTTALIAGQYTTFYINGYPTGLTNETSTHSVESVSLYNRTLSADEIMTMYNSRGFRHSIVDGLLSHYEFDEAGAGATASTIIDLASTPSNLTWTGAGTVMTYTYSNGDTSLRPVL